jgi:hypothetical protein
MSTFQNWLEVRDAKNGALGFVRVVFDFPAMGQDDLLHDGQAQASAFGGGGKIGLKNLSAMVVRHAWTIIDHIDHRFSIVQALRNDPNLASH